MFVGRREGVLSGWMLYMEVPDSFYWPSLWLLGLLRSAIPRVIEFFLQWFSFLRPFDGRWRTLHTYFYLRSRHPALER
jgi:hypothetical protein